METKNIITYDFGKDYLMNIENFDASALPYWVASQARNDK